MKLFSFQCKNFFNIFGAMGLFFSALVVCNGPNAMAEVRWTEESYWREGIFENLGSLPQNHFFRKAFVFMRIFEKRILAIEAMLDLAETEKGSLSFDALDNAIATAVKRNFPTENIAILKAQRETKLNHFSSTIPLYNGLIDAIRADLNTILDSPNTEYDVENFHNLCDLNAILSMPNHTQQYYDAYRGRLLAPGTVKMLETALDFYKLQLAQAETKWVQYGLRLSFASLFQIVYTATHHAHSAAETFNNLVQWSQNIH